MTTVRQAVACWSFGLAIVTAALPVRGQNCSEHFDSTFAAIEKVIFERRGCTASVCHSGPAPAGGLDLSPGVAYDNLIDVPAQTVPAETYPGLMRVLPGNKSHSLLWLNLAGGTLPEAWTAPLRPMPFGAAPLSFDELELVRLWLEYGATRDGVVPGSAELIDACLPPPRPLETEPLPPPAPGTGVQLRSPRQLLAPRSERETCFATYYDLTDQVPAQFLDETGTRFRYKRSIARQDPHSHHGVVLAYGGTTPIDSPIWGAFSCAGGERDGESCAPTDPDACGPDPYCSSPPVPSVACIGYGPGDADVLGSHILFSTMGTVATGIEGVYSEAPLKGILVWNSHAFNTTDEPAKLEMWVNFEFSPPAEQIRPLQGFIDISKISGMNVPAFSTQEICHHYALPAATRLLDLTSHVHQRGKRFRIFDGNFTCEGGARAGQACSPFGIDPGFPTPDLCAGAPCTSRIVPRGGDCDSDLIVTVAELVTAVNIALEREQVSACSDVDRDRNGKATVDELVTAVAALLGGGMRNAEDSLLYTSLTYGDPLVVSFNPARRVPADATVADRTLTYCSLYDNGFTDPDAVKRHSRRPPNAAGCTPTHCAEGDVGKRCSRDGDCNSTPGAGDGRCDACSLAFGLSTDDEMFVLIGSFVSE